MTTAGRPYSEFWGDEIVRVKNIIIEARNLAEDKGDDGIREILERALDIIGQFGASE